MGSRDANSADESNNHTILAWMPRSLSLPQTSMSTHTHTHTHNIPGAAAPARAPAWPGWQPGAACAPPAA
eukprot:688935-Pelagomonas_calceolata.AAC.1